MASPVTLMWNTPHYPLKVYARIPLTWLGCVLNCDFYHILVIKLLLRM